MLDNISEYKYETPYKGSFFITQCVDNGMVILKHGAIKIRHDIRRTKPYKSDTNF